MTTMITTVEVESAMHCSVPFTSMLNDNNVDQCTNILDSFKKGGLKKAQTNDRSGPNLTQPKGGGGAGMRGGMPPMF